MFVDRNDMSDNTSSWVDDNGFNDCEFAAIGHQSARKCEKGGWKSGSVREAVHGRLSGLLWEARLRTLTTSDVELCHRLEDGVKVSRWGR
jgi:hypothetical protein